MQQDTDAFELKRLMRQEAHEKAFEYQVMGQRQFESDRDRFLKEGKSKAEEEQDKRINKLNEDVKIKFSKKANETRIRKLKCRHSQLNKVREDVKAKLI